jgi:hypothetical protein
MITRHRTPSFVVALTFASIFVAAGRAQTSSWELGHPDAKLLMGLDLKGLRDSAAGQTLSAQMKGPKQPLGPGAFAFGFLDQIDRIFISSPAQPSASAAKGKTAAAGNTPFLAVVEGRLSLQQLLAFLPSTAHRYRDVDVYRGSKATDASMATLDARTIVLGDEKSVLAAIDRRGRTLPPASAILKRAQALSATHEFWLISDAPLSKFQPASAGLPNAATEQIARQIKGLDLGLSVHDGFQFEMSMGLESEAVAAQLSQLLPTEIAAAMQKQSKLSPADLAQVEEMLKRLRFEPDGAHLRISFSLTAAEFAQQVQAAQAALAARNAFAPVKPQPKPATPGKVKIYGLDDGVHEIQLTH